jgi:hypothetical protein
MFRSFARTASSLGFAAAGSLLLCSGVNPAQAQSPVGYIVDIPFAFQMNNQTLPAGKYQVRLRSSPQDLTLTEIGGKHHTGYAVVYGADDAKNENAVMRFTRYGNATFVRDFSPAATGTLRHFVSRCSVSAAERRAEKDWVQTHQTFTTVAINAYPQH